jgi:hypothetical protein
MDNCIVVNFPQGSGGHIIGRLIASCNNVQWYNHEANGAEPWQRYTFDEKFTPFHFSRRFAGADRKGYGTNSIPPVLDLASKNGINTTFEEQQLIIREWKEALAPNYFVYTLHADLARSHKLFHPAHHIVVIPDIDMLVERYMKTSANYYINTQQKETTYLDYYSKQGNCVEDAVRADLQINIDNYKDNLLETDFVVTHYKQLLDQSVFIKMCDQFNLTFNEHRYNDVKAFVEEHDNT